MVAPHRKTARVGRKGLHRLIHESQKVAGNHIIILQKNQPVVGPKNILHRLPNISLRAKVLIPRQEGDFTKALKTFHIGPDPPVGCNHRICKRRVQSDVEMGLTSLWALFQGCDEIAKMLPPVAGGDQHRDQGGPADLAAFFFCTLSPIGTFTLCPTSL